MRRLDGHIAEIFDSCDEFRGWGFSGLPGLRRGHGCDGVRGGVSAKSSAKFGVLRGLQGTTFR
jgi:hypothetical protein